MFSENNEQPKIEFEVDDKLDSIGRLEKYHKTEFNLQRFVLARDIYSTIVEVGYTTSVKKVIRYIKIFVKDKDTIVRQVMVKNVSKIYDYFKIREKSKTKLDKFLKELFLPVSFTLASDENEEVNDQGIDILTKFTKLLKNNNEKEEFVLKKIFALVNDNQNIIKKIVGAKILCRIAPGLGKEISLSKVVPKVLELAKDMGNINLRKTVSRNLGILSSILGVEETERQIMPVYINLCQDEIWCVRKSSVKCLPKMAESVSQKCRSEEIAGLFEMLKKDVSRWVKLESYRQLGPFISTFPPGTVHDRLVSFYVNMSLQKDAVYSTSLSSDLFHFAAYNFPAVVKAVGPNRWFQLEAAYKYLTKHSQWNIRKSLACSFHIIAEEVGQKIFEKQLTETFEFFLQDLDEIKVEVIKNMSTILKVFSPSSLRMEYFTRLIKIPEESTNWRIRFQFSCQAVELSKLIVNEKKCSEATHRDRLLELVLELLNDPFSSIRKQTAKITGPLLKHYIEIGDKKCKAKLIERVQQLLAGKWNRRQLYIYACKSLVENITDRNLFINEFLKRIFKLNDDKIANIRTDLLDFYNFAKKQEIMKDCKDLVNALEYVEKVEERALIEDGDD